MPRVAPGGGAGSVPRVPGGVSRRQGRAVAPLRVFRLSGFRITMLTCFPVLASALFRGCAAARPARVTPRPRRDSAVSTDWRTHQHAHGRGPPPPRTPRPARDLTAARDRPPPRPPRRSPPRAARRRTGSGSRMGLQYLRACSVTVGIPGASPCRPLGRRRPRLKFYPAHSTSSTAYGASSGRGRPPLRAGPRPGPARPLAAPGKE